MRKLSITSILRYGLCLLFTALIATAHAWEKIAAAEYQQRRDKAVAVVADGLLKLGIIPEAKAVKKYLPHGVSHHIGLETHDAGEYALLQAGMVITMEPGIYIPVESPDVDAQYRGIGIRIEDDILITSTGHEVITDAVPRAIAEIEKLMQEKGLGQIWIK